MEEKRIPVIRANSDDLNLLFEFHAACQTLKTFEQTQERRVRAIPNGWRDLKLCKTLMYRLRDNLKQTLQPEKISAMDRMGPRMRFKTWCGIQTIETGPSEVVLEQKEFETLLHYARMECMMCVEQRCKQCRLGKTLDSVLVHDRGDGSWANIRLQSDEN